MMDTNKAAIIEAFATYSPTDLARELAGDVIVTLSDPKIDEYDEMIEAVFLAFSQVIAEAARAERERHYNDPRERDGSPMISMRTHRDSIENAIEKEREAPVTDAMIAAYEKSMLDNVLMDSAREARRIAIAAAIRARTATQAEGKCPYDTPSGVCTRKRGIENCLCRATPQPQASPSQEGYTHLTNGRLCEIVEQRHGAYGDLERAMAAELLDRRARLSQEGGMREALEKMTQLARDFALSAYDGDDDGSDSAIAKINTAYLAALAHDGGRGRPIPEDEPHSTLAGPQGN